MAARTYKIVAQLSPTSSPTLLYTPGTGVNDFIASGLTIVNNDSSKRVWIAVYATQTGTTPVDANLVYPKTCIEPNGSISILAGTCLSVGQSFYVGVVNPESAEAPVFTLFGTEG